ncbi:MAG: MBL fold metallo-hydrolase [Oscillospiraceae bacterium]|nr:MBL fold metallo-hydrolase [Oscillospiraceae bacterium]
MEVRNVSHGEGKLSTKVCFSDERGFSVASVIVYGKEEAVLIDTQWSRANAYRVAAEICELGKKLTTIYVTHAHPDHYFGTAYIAEQFPGVRCIAPPEDCVTINTQFFDKIDHWTEVIGWLNVCTKNVELEPLPEDNTIWIEGEKIEIFTHRMGDLRYNSLVWIPSISTVYGSDILFNEAHPFTCEVSREERKLWMEDLDFIDTLKPEVIIPGHAKPGLPFDHSSVDFMREYLIATEETIESTKDAGNFFLQMCQRFPNANLVMLSNEMNANVFKGGREWNWREEDFDPAAEK